MVHLYLVRHGETADNRSHRYLGRRDLPLTEKGHQQAQILARQFKEIPFAHVYASPLSRTLDTAVAIAASHHLSVIADPRWVELDFGCWDGLTFDEVTQRYPDEQRQWLDDPEHVAPPRGETVQQLRLRVQSTLDNIQQTHGDQTVLVVTHGGPIRLAVNLLTGKSIWDVEIPCGGSCHLMCDLRGNTMSER